MKLYYKAIFLLNFWFECDHYIEYPHEKPQHLSQSATKTILHL